MPFTPFVLRVLPVNGHCKDSIVVLFINSNAVLSSLHLDFSIGQIPMQRRQDSVAIDGEHSY